MSLRSPLARVLGQGSAKEGVQHWWVQRLTSVALVPLTVWFVVSLLSLPALDHATVVAWIGQLWTAVFLILLCSPPPGIPSSACGWWWRTTSTAAARRR